MAVMQFKQPKFQERARGHMMYLISPFTLLL